VTYITIIPYNNGEVNSMSSVSKNIKRLRLLAGLTQDRLAAELHVTRQAVSNWENGKTQPDLETLRSIADVFETDEMEVIYGKKAISQSPNNYPENKALRVRITVLFGILSMIFLAIKLIWLPQSLVEYSYYRYQMAPVYASLLLIRPLLILSVCLFALNLLSIWKDIRIKNRIPQRLSLIIAIVCIVLHYGLSLLFLWEPGASSLPRFLFDFFIVIFTNPEYIFSATGIAAFLGLNR